MTSSISSPTIGLVRLPHGESLSLPAYETAGAAGMDLRAAVREDARVILTPGRRALIPTGFILQLPEGFEAQIRPRSGLALKYGVTCLNTPGTIDSDYRGEIQVLLINLGHDDFQITRGMRIAQMVISPVVQARLDVRVAANTTDRGDGGFGSTGSH